MRRHAAGEFAADLPWLLRLALLGPFVRVPEALITKAFRDGGLSASWPHDPRGRLAVAWACVQAVREARIPLPRQLRLFAAAGIFTLRTELWCLKNRHSSPSK
jgi:hypothetical protein